MQHGDTGRSLAIDPYEDIFPNWRKFLVSATSEANPTARNTFRITRPPTKLKNIEDNENDPVLRYGQPFFLACSEWLLVSSDNLTMAPPLYLSSTLKNERTTTRTSNRQAVYMTANVDTEGVWYVMKPSLGKSGGAERYIAIGTPVHAGDNFVLVHRSTNTYVTCDPRSKEITDFGQEYECFAVRDSLNGMLSLMQVEFSGTGTVTTVAKSDKLSNYWSFVTASSPSASRPISSLPSKPALDDLIYELNRNTLGAGINGFTSLRRSLADIDRDPKGGVGDGKVDKQDVKSVLRSRGLNVENNYFDPVLDCLDVSGSSLIDYRDFLRLIRGPISNARRDLLVEVFRSFNLGAASNDNIDFAELQRKTNFSNYPAVQSGEITAREMLNNYFVKVIDVIRRHKAAPVVNLDSFLDYCADISAFVEDDRDFHDIILSIWSQ